MRVGDSGTRDVTIFVGKRGMLHLSVVVIDGISEIQIRRPQLVSTSFIITSLFFQHVRTGRFRIDLDLEF